MKPSGIPLINHVLPWRSIQLDVRPLPNTFAFNPSVCFHDGALWCAVRCANWCSAGGVPQRLSAGVMSSKILLGHLPEWTHQQDGLGLIEATELVETHDFPTLRGCKNRGFHDPRLFVADGRLVAIVASHHLTRRVSVAQNKKRANRPHPPEQVVLELDVEASTITAATPIRGTWSGAAQKNWVPFNGTTEPRFLYSIEHGPVFGVNGQITTGKTGLHTGLRGGSQLIHIGDDNWIGIGHRVRPNKRYSHHFYLVDSNGTLRGMSPELKLHPAQIEFAAGLAIDGDRMLISFGVDDVACFLGETSFGAVLDLFESAGSAVAHG